MARVHPIQTNFTAGELSPKLAGQVDFKKYANGVETLENMTVFPQGGATRRYGSRFICEVKDSSATTRLIPFEFNDEQAYILEFGNNYIRFFKDQGQITEADKTITGITKANPAVVTTSTSHGYSNGDDIWINSVGGMTEVNGRRFTIGNVTSTTFELTGVDSTNYTTYTSGGTAAKVYEIATPYTSAQVFDLQFAQSADVMYIVHPSHEPEKLSRTGHTSWTLADVVFEKGPYLDTNTTTTTLNPASHTVGTGVAVVASATTGINGGDGFQATDVGRLLRFRDGHAKITARADTTNITIEILVDLGSATASTDWQLGTFSDTTGFPKAVTFFEQRLIYGGTTSFPQTIFASESGFFDNFDVGDSSDAKAFVYTIAANKVNVIRFLAPARDLIIGTAGGEFIVGRPTGEPLKPGNVNITQQTTYGTHTTQPVQIGNTVLFVQRQKRKLRELGYNFGDDAYVAPDLTLLSEHITEGGIVDVDYAQEPDSIYWAVRNDGVLLGMTYLRTQDIVAWHKHTLGGTSAAVKSVSTIAEENEQQTYLIVSRTINSATKQYVEYLDSTLNQDSALSGTVTGSSTSVTGLDHLEGETVQILIDDAVYPTQTVTNGAITVSLPSSFGSKTIEIGLGFTSTIKTMKPEAGSQAGTAQGRKKRYNEVSVRLLNSVGVTINGDQLPFRTSADEMGEPIPAFTGDKRVTNLGWDREGQITIQQTQPLPLTVLSITGTLVTSD